jgi:hypothetical protein
MLENDVGIENGSEWGGYIPESREDVVKNGEEAACCGCMVSQATRIGM